MPECESTPAKVTRAPALQVLSSSSKRDSCAVYWLDRTRVVLADVPPRALPVEPAPSIPYEVIPEPDAAVIGLYSTCPGVPTPVGGAEARTVCNCVLVVMLPPAGPCCALVNGLTGKLPAVPPEP
jgi:hypothetical protein